MKTLTGMAAIVMSGVLIAGTAFAQAGTGAGSTADKQAGSAKQETNQNDKQADSAKQDATQKDKQAGSTKQDANQKARGRADAGQPGAGERSSSGKDASANATSTGMPGADKQTVTNVQEALKDKGQDPGPIDGVMGARTRAALQAYQKAQGLEATGRLDAKTMASLGIQTPANDGSSASPSSPSAPPGAGGSTGGTR